MRKKCTLKIHLDIIAMTTFIMQKAKVKSLSENLPRISSSGKLNLTCLGVGERDAAVPAAKKENNAMQQDATNGLVAAVVSTVISTIHHWTGLSSCTS